eukprot:8044478-Pyramimonas_sp.AAC.1
MESYACMIRFPPMPALPLFLSASKEINLCQDSGVTCVLRIFISNWSRRRWKKKASFLHLSSHCRRA